LTPHACQGIIAQMPRTVFITEGDSPLGGALARLLLARGYLVAATVSRAAGSQSPQDSRGAAVVPVAWNRRSPLSARTVFLDAVNSFTDIDEMLILEPPSPAAARFHEAASADIERALDDVKGPIFLAREALGHFLKRGKGLLAMVCGSAAETPLESGVRECLRGVCTALMLDSGASGVLVNGFQSGGAGFEEYAAFIDKTLEEKARKITGRWFTCPTRGGFLQGVLAGPSRKSP
jgi:NAD(P)-dependent dehydrogenase (short-subunit alcohol dehydrogenase family)